MAMVLEVVVSLLIVVGALFALIGSWGLVKLPDLMTRLHAPTKATTLGMWGVLAASMVHFIARGGGISAHELLISLFLFLAAPITANLLAKAYLHCHLDPVRELPPTGGPAGWSTFDQAPPESADAGDSIRRSPPG